MAEQTIHIHRELALEAGAGNSQAQFRIYELYYKAMFTTAVRIVGDSMQAEECMQDGFMAAFSKIDKWHQRASFGAWLKRIIVNECLDYLAKKKLNLVSIDTVQVSNENEQIKETEEPEYTIDEVKAAMTNLAPGYRVILSLYLFEGYDHEEIGEILKISSSTSRSQYLRAKKKLIAQIKNTDYAR